MIARFSLSEGGDEVHPSYIPILHPDIYCSNWLLVIPATLINSGQRIFLVGKLSFKRIA